jgi:hypothetical protein
MAEFLYWEPQRINRQSQPEGDLPAFESVMANLQTLEVPLNRLFDVMMRLAPQRIKRQILAGFGPACGDDFGEQIEYISIYDRLPHEDIEFIQPDVVLESETAHICLELKIGAPLSLNQIYKYLALSGLWQTKTEANTIPYLFLLTKKNLAAQWDSKERDIIFTKTDDLTSLQHYLKTANLPAKFSWTNTLIDPHKAIEEVGENIRLGWTSWQNVGNILDTELRLLDQDGMSEGAEILQNLLGDFLAELAYRGLWKSTAQRIEM